MRLVIPYKHTENSSELRYAIRSMVKHFKPLSGVLLIGDKPEWYCGDHIPMADVMHEDRPTINKERSIQLKVLACPDDVFLYSNDDFFALQDFTTLPNYFDVTCGEMAIKHSVASYRRMYENCLPHWLNFDVHTPMIIKREWFEQSFKSMDDQMPIKTAYTNFNYGSHFSEYLCDVKIRGEHSYQEIKDIIKDRPFFSTHNNSLNDDMMKVLEELYPNKSPYEL